MSGNAPGHDPLRAVGLGGPYYGVPEIRYISPAALTLTRAESHAALTVRVQELAQDLQSVSALLNNTAPINMLPKELLIEIFMELQREDEGFCWLTVLSVCRRWFADGSTAATLWQNLKAKGSTNLLRTGLARSRRAGLSIEITTNAIVPFEDSTSCLLSHLYRLRSLKLGTLSERCIPVFTSFMRFAMPALHSLQVRAVRPGGPEILVDLFPNQFPRLQELDIVNINVFGNTDIALQLQTASISGCYGYNPELKTATIVEMVRKMQNIRVLHMHDVCARDLEDAPTEPEGERVTLPHLRKVVLTTDGGVIKAILCAIIIPPAATVSFTSQFLGEDEETSAVDLEAMVPHDRNCLPILASIVAASLTTTPHYHILVGHTTPAPHPSATPNIRLCIDINDDEEPVAIGLRDLSYVFHHMPLRCMTLLTTFAVITDTDWPVFLSNFPALHTLQINVDEGCEGNLYAAEQIVRALDPGEEAAAAGLAAMRLASGYRALPPVLCPGLRCLHLLGDEAWVASDGLLDVVVACLEHRRCALGTPEMRLEQLVLDMADHRCEAHFQYTRAAFMERLAPLVDVVIYQTSDRWQIVSA